MRRLEGTGECSSQNVCDINERQNFAGDDDCALAELRRARMLGVFRRGDDVFEAI